MRSSYLLILLATFLLLGCSKEDEPETGYSPVLMLREDLLKSISLEAPQPIGNWGKIYTFKNRLFVIEDTRGVHLIDNSDANNPENLAFIRIPGIMDLAVRDGIIYADNAVDLVSLRYENGVLQLLYREQDVFPEIVAPDLGRIPDRYLPENRPANTVIVRWEKR